MIVRQLRDVEPVCALPAGRIGYDITADVLLLHTVQSAEAYEVLCADGTLVANPALACPDFAEAYDWMCRQMAARLPTTGQAALWLGARVRRDALVSDCRRSRGSVLLTCRVPRARVLLSHFLDWHLVLNRTLNVPRVAGESDDDLWQRSERAWDEFDALRDAAGVSDRAIGEWPKDLRDRIERSWQGILDPANYGRYECWQATVHALHAADVVDAVRIQP